MREYFRIGLRRKFVVSVAEQLVLNLLIIFDHAVMHERQFSAGVEMRMCVLVGGFSVRRPARMADAECAPDRLVGHQSRKSGNASGAFARFDMVALCDGDPGRVITAIFEAAKTIQQNWC